MTKQYKDKQLTLRTSITNNGTLVDPTTVTFKYRIRRTGEETTATVTNVSTGLYQTIITPDHEGTLYGKWESNGVVEIVRPVIIPIHNPQGIRG